MTRPVTTLPVGRTDLGLARTVSRALRHAMDGTGPAIAPVEPDGPSPDLPVSRGVPDDVALVVRTSGSTGQPRGVMLAAAALQASAAATHARLGGPGRWVLALPLTHVAGLQVLLRAAAAGVEPLVVPAGAGFSPADLATVVAGAPSDLPLYTSLVPTQLHRVLEPTADPSWVGALRRVDALLLGGAAAPPALLRAAADAGLRVVTTYGMTETCGGCVYDGHPLDGVRVAVDPQGRIVLAGPVLAQGYLGRPDLDAEAFHLDESTGARWLRTQDLGSLDGGRLTVLGRVDEVIITGGVNVAPAPVEAALAALPGVGQVCVVGVPDTRWGQALTAVVVVAPGSVPPDLGDARAAVTRTLGGAAAPRHVVVVGSLPERGPGKVDRAAVAVLAARALDRTPWTETDGHPR
ncbi:o-succinylbenzoate--CoA ligase [Actinotalea sp. K2]|uniref:o-succinylbenzoate--CoA ligase n=1 Tax=Actinotalea sp. K2 TaxID=2939438 RepID=UPI00201747CA|nr:o-succinylbenzoate--CoA ligase [Actinotalea sp. K2]MCL3863050.1 o-succinylbenzoate--CoA ligase [Actinotalea sp. K2]